MIEVTLNIEETLYTITDARLLASDTVSKKVESDKKGQPGLIVFDSMPVELVIKDEPLKSVLTEENFARIENLYGNYKFISATVRLKIEDTWQFLFDGIIDYESVVFTDTETITFDLLDRISALKLMENKNARSRISVKNGRHGQTLPWLVPLNYGDNEYYKITIAMSGGNFAIEINKYVRINELYQWVHVSVHSTPLFQPGEILEVYNGSSFRKFALIIKSYCAENPEYPGEYDTWGLYDSLSDDISGAYYISSAQVESYLSSDSTKKFYYYKDEFYGGGVITYKENNIVKSFNAILLIKNLIQGFWPDMAFTTFTNLFQIPLSYWLKTIDDMPLEKHPLDALKFLANSMQCYFYIDSAGTFNIKGKQLLYETSVPNDRVLNIDDLLKHSVGYYWDKKIDAITVTVLTPYNYTGSAYLQTGNQEIQPQNAIEVEVFTDSAHKTQAEVNALAAEVANQFMNFYGKRRALLSYSKKINNNTITYALTHNNIFRLKRFFIITLKLNTKAMTMDVEAVNIDDLNNN